MTVLARRPVDDAVRDALATALARPVGLEEAPTLSGADPYPYVVIYALGAASWGPLADPDADQRLIYQVTSVGRRHDQAAATADRIVQLWLERDSSGRFTTNLGLAVAGVREMGRWRQDGFRDTQTAASGDVRIWSIAERLELAITPPP